MSTDPGLCFLFIYFNLWFLKQNEKKKNLLLILLTFKSFFFNVGNSSNIVNARYVKVM